MSGRGSDATRIAPADRASRRREAITPLAAARGVGASRAVATPIVVYIFLALCMALVLPAAAGAQVTLDTITNAPPGSPLAPDTVPLTLSLREAIERALARNPAVLRARARSTEADALVRVARAQRLPQVSGLGSYTHVFRSPFLDQEVPFFPDTLAPVDTLGGSIPNLLLPTSPFVGASRALRAPLQFFPPTGDSTFGPSPFGSNFGFAARNNWFIGLSLSQALYNGGRIGADVAAARRRAEAARLTVVETEGEIALEVKRAYYDAVLAEELIAIALASLRLAAEQLEVTRIRRREGTASELDVLRAEVERENLTPQLVDAENARTTGRMDLRSLIDFPLDSALILTTGLCPAPRNEPPVEPLPGAPTRPDGERDGSRRPDRLPPSSLADSLIEDRPALVAAEREVEARREELRLARAAFRPTLSISGFFGWQAFSGSIIPGFDEWGASWFATLDFQIPLYLGGSLRARRDAARARAAQAEQDLAEQRETAREDYREALAALERAWAQVEVRHRTVTAAERIYELNRLRYMEGVAIQLEVLDAATALRQARTNLVRGYYDYFLALARAEEAIGRPVEAMVLPGAPCIAPG